MPVPSPPRPRPVRRLLVGAGLAALGGCATGVATAPGDAPNPTTAPVSSTTALVSPPATAPAPAPAAPSGLVVSPGPGWGQSGLEGPVPDTGACHSRSAADGRPLPDPGCTPGAVDGSVTQADLGSTLCRPGGYTSSVRPPVSMTEPFKYSVMGAYGDGGSASAYELDHLVPLELGGSSDTRNLWPEPDDHPSAGVANSKDPVENQLHDLVCAAASGGPYLPLATAQHLIAADWTTALAKAQGAMVGR
ncbi:MAG TPA: hypothetical protein VMU09_03170 [Acidimicrobiales bacterium]|nr:hypothetical protein [Acidimicrobiales bacterium]